MTLQARIEASLGGEIDEAAVREAIALLDRGPTLGLGRGGRAQRLGEPGADGRQELVERIGRWLGLCHGKIPWQEHLCVLPYYSTTGRIFATDFRGALPSYTTEIGCLGLAIFRSAVLCGY